jgi:hypothetical protein
MLILPQWNRHHQLNLQQFLPNRHHRLRQLLIQMSQ